MMSWEEWHRCNACGSGNVRVYSEPVTLMAKYECLDCGSDDCCWGVEWKRGDKAADEWYDNLIASKRCE